MALADIIDFVSAEKDKKIAELTSQSDKAIKELLEVAEQKGKEYSAKKFTEYENLEALLGRKNVSEIARLEKIKKAELVDSLVTEVFSALESEILSFSEKDAVKYFAKQISDITEVEGTIESKGTPVAVLEQAVSTAGKKFSVIEGSGNGGFVFKGDNFIADFTIKTFVQGYLKDMYTADLVEKIFA